MDLAQALRNARPNETIRLPAGRYTGAFLIEKPVTLLAVGQVVLDALHAGTVLRVECPEGTVRVSGCMIVGGNAPDAGGGVCLVAGNLELTDCTLRFNKAPLYGGGGLAVLDGKALAQRCRFEANTGRQGGAILVDGVGELRLEDCAVLQNAAVEGGGLRVKEGAKAELFACTLADNKVVGEGSQGGAIHLSGTTTRAPTVSLSHCIVSERAKGPACIANGPKLPGTLSFTRTLLPEWCRDLGSPGPFGPAGFTMTGTEPYLLTEASPAVGAGDASAFAAGSRDLLGRPRVRQGKVDLGAFAFSGGGSGGVGY
jgi:hypothetical protein